MNKQNIVSVKLTDEEMEFFDKWKYYMDSKSPFPKVRWTISVFLHDALRCYMNSHGKVINKVDCKKG